MNYIKLNLEEALICCSALNAFRISVEESIRDGDSDDKRIGDQVLLIINPLISKLSEIEGVDSKAIFLSDKLVDIIASRAFGY